MNSIDTPSCQCAACPGASCTCGCQTTANPQASAATCGCGSGCRCTEAGGVCSCGAPAGVEAA